MHIEKHNVFMTFVGIILVLALITVFGKVVQNTLVQISNPLIYTFVGIVLFVAPICLICIVLEIF